MKYKTFEDPIEQLEREHIFYRYAPLCELRKIEGESDE